MGFAASDAGDFAAGASVGPVLLLAEGEPLTVTGAGAPGRVLPPFAGAELLTDGADLSAGLETGAGAGAATGAGCTEALGAAARGAA